MKAARQAWFEDQDELDIERLFFIDECGTNTKMARISTRYSMSGIRSSATLANRVLFAETSGNGWSVIERRRNSPAADEVTALAAEVSNVLESL